MNERPRSGNLPGQQAKGTRALFLSIVAGIFLFMLATVPVNQSMGPLAPALNAWHVWLNVAAIAIYFGCSLLAKYLFAKGMRLAKNSINPLVDKLKRYRISLIVYLAISEAPILLCIVLFLLTGNFVYQVYSCVFLGFILVMFPTRRKMVEQLGLDGQQQMELD